MSGRAIREMDRADIPAIMEIERASFPTPWTMGMFAMQLAFKERTMNLVLEEDGFIAAYAALALAFDEMHLLSIAVAPERRRRGLGAALLDEVTARGRARGAAGGRARAPWRGSIRVRNQLCQR